MLSRWCNGLADQTRFVHMRFTTFDVSPVDARRQTLAERTPALMHSDRAYVGWLSRLNDMDWTYAKMQRDRHIKP